jgi:MOSC domain-containing protein YiiM
MHARLARANQVDPVGLRHDQVVSGIELLALRSARLQTGTARLEVVGARQPHSGLEATTGPTGMDQPAGQLTAGKPGLPPVPTSGAVRGAEVASVKQVAPTA